MRNRPRAEEDDALSRSHRGPTVDGTLRRPEPRVRDVAAALLCLDSPDRRAFIGPPIVLIERVVADGERPRPDPGMSADADRAAPRRIGGVAR
jgi:hypothetical protein